MYFVRCAKHTLTLHRSHSLSSTRCVASRRPIFSLKFATQTTIIILKAFHVYRFSRHTSRDASMLASLCDHRHIMLVVYFYRLLLHFQRFKLIILKLIEKTVDPENGLQLMSQPHACYFQNVFFHLSHVLLFLPFSSFI